MSKKKYYFNEENFSDDNVLRVKCSDEPLGVYKRTAPHWAASTMVRSRKKPKRLLPTPATYEEYQSCSLTGEYFPCQKWPNSTSSRSGSHYEFVFNSQTYKYRSGTLNSEDDGSLAMMQLLAGSSNYGAFENFGETLAELNQTGAMVYNRAKQIVHIASALKKGNWRQLEQAIKGDVPRSVTSLPASKRLANGWLELEFGWKPLVSTVYGAVEAYRSNIVNGMQIKSKRFSNVPMSVARDLDKYREHVREHKSPRASARVYATVGNKDLYMLNQLGLINPASLAWDLLPYSFVVDWFYPIGRVLKYMTDRVGLEDYMMLTTHESLSFNQWRQYDAYGHTRRTVYRRVIRPSIVPPIGYSHRSLGVWHATTAAALIRQAFSR